MKKSCQIRSERPEDYRIVEEITREAFWNLFVPGCNEHLCVHKMRKHPDFIPELAFVAESEGHVVGSIFYTRTKVCAPDGHEHEFVSFGPVSVDPRQQKSGIGSALINYSLAEAKRLGFTAVFIGGDPQYYCRFGFSGAKKFGVSMEDGNYYVGIQALPLCPGALDGVCGKLLFSKALDTTEAETEEFDKTFPPKTKHETETQKRFAVISQQRDES